MSSLIAISGACHSGKTTLINKACEQFPTRFARLSELMRKYDDESIDELRKRPSDYLKRQLTIIPQKILQENEALNSYDTRIVLVDRSLVDSLYYYTFYVDKSQLTPEELDSYFVFLNLLLVEIRNRYKAVLLLEPLKIVEEDKFRPKHLEVAQEAEWEMIKALTLGLRPCRRDPIITHADKALSVLESLH
jgi:nicotinamide riboside kinase